MNNLDLLLNTVEFRKMFGQDDHSPIDILSLAYLMEETTIVFYPMGKNISGMCIKKKHNNLIAINSMMSRGRQRFSMAHEIYHLLYDDQLGNNICQRDIGSGDENERRADEFASLLLIPPYSLKEQIKKIKQKHEKIILSDVILLEQFYQVSRQAMLYRLYELKEIDDESFILYKKNVIQSAVSLGYCDDLYKPSTESKKYMTYGNYIKLAEKCLALNFISQGKYEELLLEAFRTDIVYGSDLDGDDYE